MQSQKHPYNPWYKATYAVDAIGIKLQLRVPHDVFSTQRIDEGTLLLLENLASSIPNTVLDMGCGYGALGLPIAARFPQAQVEMVDRDLLAADWSAANAKNNQLTNVRAHGSLGFRDVASANYDWILCNVPARIGRPFIQYLVEEGRARLNRGGDLRVVVINDLAVTMKELEAERSWKMTEVKRGPRHTVFAFGPEERRDPAPADQQLYLRDRVDFEGLNVARPFDLGGDDPRRLSQGLPVLIDALPRNFSKKRVLCFRTVYGLLPLICRRRWPDVQVVAVDRDLLGTTFVRLNAAEQALSGPQFDVRESAHFPDALAVGETFDLIVGELSPSVGDGVVQAELRAISAAIAEGGQAYLLCPDKLDKESVRPFASKARLSLMAVIKRNGYTLLRMS